MASLTVVSGQLAGTTIEIADELLIGRVDADLTLDDDEVSRRHAVVRRVGGSLEVEDLGSFNGTFVDGVRIDGPTLVGNGAKVRVGATELVVESEPAGATVASSQQAASLMQPGASLTVVSGQLAGTTIEVGDELLIGRVDADLTLDDDEVSHRHTVVRRVGGSLEVEDLGSSNGTFVDGARITGRTLVGNGARLTVGTTELVVGGPVGETLVSGQSDPWTTSADPGATSVAAAAEVRHDVTRNRAAAPPSPTGEPSAPEREADRRFRPDRSRLASRRFVSLALGLGTAVAVGLVVYFLTSTGSSAKASLIDVPIRFTVDDVNRSLLRCAASGRTYELAGRLVAPSTPGGSSATVYVSGVIFSSLFEFHNDLVPGYDYAREMAALGHASVVIDRVGYGKTVPYPADGRSVCMGAQADMLHQVVAALHTGGYGVAGSSGTRPRTFSRIAVAGYSLGALVAELEAASYADVQSLVAIGWAHQGFTSYGASPEYVQAHCSPGLPKPPGGLRGYFRTLSPRKVPPLVSGNADPAVVATFARNDELDACGQFLTAAQWFTGLNRTALARVRVPVLVIYGYWDVLFNPGAWQSEWAHFTGTRDRTLIGIPDGQMLMLDSHVTLSRHVISDWLDNHGF